MNPHEHRTAILSEFLAGRCFRRFCHDKYDLLRGIALTLSVPIKMDVSVYHHGDWTTFTERFPELAIWGKFYAPNPTSGVGTELMIAECGVEIFEEFQRKIKRSGTNVKLLFNSKQRGRFREILIQGPYEPSIKRRIMNSNGFVTNYSVKGGFEQYTVCFFQKDCSEDLLQDIEKISEVKSFSSTKLSNKEMFCSFRSGVFGFDEEVLKFALKNGFFDSPRRIDLDDLSLKFGASKSTINYHLKKGLTEVLSEHLLPYR
ncbi:MAG: helix-turn-helix domain-containing protein [Nitrososphaerota archaeon]|nr:helix-turn-helix domain-containing protein [Nitrososphaerota archaeon]